MELTSLELVDTPIDALEDRYWGTHSSFFFLTGTTGLKSILGFAGGLSFLRSVEPITTGVEPLASADGVPPAVDPPRVPIRGFTSGVEEEASGGGGGEDMMGRAEGRGGWEEREGREGRESSKFTFAF